MSDAIFHYGRFVGWSDHDLKQRIAELEQENNLLRESLELSNEKSSDLITMASKLSNIQRENERLREEMKIKGKIIDLCWPVVESVINTAPHAEPLGSLAKKAFFHDF